MQNLVDYIDWRGDLSFEKSGFNEVDNLVFSEISYLNLGIVKGELELGSLLEGYSNYIKRRKITKEVVPDFVLGIEKMFLKAVVSERFKKIRVCDYISKFDEIKESQFSAMCFIIDEETIYVAYRGTDDSLIGFKEDFNMCFSAPVHGQLEAASYLRMIMKKHKDKKFIVGGHSKGGNLAVYAVTGLEDEERERIIKVYNNDGPGFTDKILQSEAYKKTVPKVIKIMPKDSVVGILMEDNEESIIIDAKGGNGFAQHNGMNWYVCGNHFVRSNRTESGKLYDKTMKSWLYSLSNKEREVFIDKFYEVIKKSTNANRLNDITDKGLSSGIKIIKNMANLNEEEKAMMQSVLLRLLKSRSDVKKKYKKKKKLIKK